ncbi:MAG: flagellar hook-associated protein FlgK, partial [Bacillota bacterium]
RQSGVTLGLWEGRHDALSQVEAIFGEPSDVGLADALNKFFAAWDELAIHPESIPVRTALVEEAKTLAAFFNQTTRGLRDLARDLDEGIATRIDEINSLASEIAAQNREIVRITAIGNDPADLKDKRDLAIARLSRLVNLRAFEVEGGSVVIEVGSTELVREDRVNKLDFASGTPLGEPIPEGEVEASRVSWSDDGSPVDIRGGEVGGLLQVRNGDLPTYYKDVENLVKTLRDEINALHIAGFGLDGSQGVFYLYDDATRVLSVNSALDPDAGGDVSRVAASKTGEPGDGANALAIAGLKDALTMNGGTVSFRGFYQQIIANLGTDARQAAYMVQVHEATLHQYTNNKDNLSGVAIDEEVANLMRYQRAYEAAARLATAIDQMLDTLINGTGIVGR